MASLILKVYPQIAPLYSLSSCMSKMRLFKLNVGEDGRNRSSLSIFSSKTGRNQPSTSQFIFGPAVWLRSLIQPNEGYGLAFVDWCQQEHGIAAALSGDANMIAAYKSGDPYLMFAKQAGAAPISATRQSHRQIREQFKTVSLAMQYGMGAESLAFRLGQPVARAQELLAMHRKTYRRFWQWSDGVLNEALLNRRLWTAFGWQLHVTEAANDRSLRNFPIQGNGAEMMRLASIRLVADGIRVCAPVHDAFVIEAPLGGLDDAIMHTQEVMQWASAQVLDGFELASDFKAVRNPDRYMDERGSKMWNDVMGQLDRIDLKALDSYPV
jgi:DNA polymerase-1